MKNLENLPEKEFNEKRDSVRKLMIGSSGLMAAFITDSYLVSLTLMISSYFYAISNLRDASEYLSWHYSRKKDSKSSNL